MVCVIDMRGRRFGGSAGPSSLSSSSAMIAAGGLRDAELKPVFKAMQNAYVRLLQNPFYEPDEHNPVGGTGGGQKITSKNFSANMQKIGETWTPGVTSL